MPARLTHPISRRSAMAVGAGAMGLTLPQVLLGQDQKQSGRVPRAKSVIILFLSGGPSQLDMWDLKPNASTDIRGTFNPIATNVPGTQISEHMPRMAQLADKYTIVRSMTHNEGEHIKGVYWIVTGNRLLRSVSALAGMQRNDHPHLGGVVSKFKPVASLPTFVTVPEFIMPREVARPGQHAGFLGPSCDPYLIKSDPNSTGYDPGPIVSSSGVRSGDARALLDSFEKVSQSPVRRAGRTLDAYRERAFDLISSPKAQRAFDISRELPQTRERYGRHTFGQSALVARRLVEAGVRVVQVNFMRHDKGPSGQGYDSHSVPPYPAHLPWAKDRLLPPTDEAFSGLIEDLDERGLLDETLVVMMGEFGRTPKINQWGGRDHWPRCYSLVVAGAGVTAGQVYGSSDKHASDVASDPVSPDDMLATVYHLLGIDYRATLHDHEARPHPIAAGRPVRGILT